MGEVTERGMTQAALLVPRLQIALAVVAALRTARRAVAGGFGLVAGAGFVAAGALHQHAAALAVGDQAALAGRLERLLAARRVFVVVGLALASPGIGRLKSAPASAAIFSPSCSRSTRVLTSST